MSRWGPTSGGRLFSGLGLLLAAAAVTGAGTLTGDPRTSAAAGPRQVPLEVGDTVLGCPAAPRLATAEGAPQTDPEFAAVAETVADVAAVATAATAAPGLALTSPAARVTGEPMGPVAAAALAGDAAVTVRASPARQRAPRSAAIATAATQGGDLRGLAAAACARPSQDAWLVGGATVVGRSTRLDLSNPGTGTATADVTVLTPTGAVQPPSAQDLPVAAGTTLELLLEGLVPQAEAVAVRVTVTGGSLVPFLVQTGLDALTPAGVEVVPPGGGAALTQVLPAVSVLPASAPPRLRLAVPGQDDAVVRWELHGPAGPVEAAGPAAATVSAGTVAEVELAGLERGTYSVLVEADVPVLAAAVSTSGGEGAAADVAWSAAAPPLDGQTLVALPDPAVPARLVVTGGGPATEVDVETVAADGTVARTDRVSVRAGSTAVLPVPASQDAPLALVVRPAPGAGPGHAALLLTAGAEGGAEMLAVTTVRGDDRTVGTVPVRPVRDGRWP